MLVAGVNLDVGRCVVVGGTPAGPAVAPVNEVDPSDTDGTWGTVPLSFVAAFVVEVV